MNSRQNLPEVTLPAPIRTGLTVHECYVDSGDVAKLLKVARSTVARWARQEMIPAHILRQGERRSWRFKLTELEDWMKRSDVRLPRRQPRPVSKWYQESLMPLTQ
jgi:excisionase family DNA binding protein